MGHVLDRVTAPLQGWSERRALRAARESADEQLLAARIASPRLAWRTAELVSGDSRIALGRSLTAAIHGADERLLPGASPLDRLTIRECRAQLLELASRVFDLEREATPRGILLLTRLLDDSSSPLYGRGEPRRLRLETRRILLALDGNDDV